MSVLFTKCPRITWFPAVQPFKGSMPNSSGLFSVLMLTVFRDVQTFMEVERDALWMRSLTEYTDG